MEVTKQKSAIVSKRLASNRDDERVRRTRQRIDAASVELLRRRAYGDIRVSDIVKKAGVGRPTFYAHYESKDDLLQSQFERGVAPMLAPVPDQPAQVDATHLFAHVGSAQRIYKSLMGPSAGTAPHVLRKCFETRIRQVLSLDSSVESGLKQFAIGRFVASSLITVIECWLDHGARETPEEVQILFIGLVSPGLHS